MIGKVIHKRWHIDAEPIIQLAYRRHPLAYRRHPLAYRRQRFSGSPVALGLQRSFKPLNLIFNLIFNPTLFASLKIAAPTLPPSWGSPRPSAGLAAASMRPQTVQTDTATTHPNKAKKAKAAWLRGTQPAQSKGKNRKCLAYGQMTLYQASAQPPSPESTAAPASSTKSG